MNTINVAKGIGFKNFRRFQEFPMLEFGNITYMVGRNNSGKSTMVKALLLVMDYLQNQLSDTFSFDNAVLEDANIVTFGRAKNNSQNVPIIVFEIQLKNYHVKIDISGNDNSTKAKVNKLTITDTTKAYELTVDHQEEVIRVKKLGKTITSDSVFKDELINIEKKLKSLIIEKKKINSKSSKEALELNSLINNLNERKEKLFVINQINEQEEDFDFDLEYPLKYQEEVEILEDEDLEDYNYLKEWEEWEKDMELQGKDKGVFSYEEYKDYWSGRWKVEKPEIKINPLQSLVSNLFYHNDIEHKLLIDARDNFDKDNKRIKNSSSILEFYNSKNDFQKWIDDLIYNIEREQYIYLGVNPSKQSALFSLREKENTLAQAVHVFYQLGITKIEGNEELRFVQEWMNAFEVGVDLDISFIAGEAYKVDIYESQEAKKNNISNHLADKGMGSLQAMTLILRIASLIRLNKDSNNKRKKFTVLVEEPELNLHPDLQSKLTEFFHEINRRYKIDFLIETHSEYMIRKSQLIGLEQEYFVNHDLNVNPFKVYYFHKAEGPYEMIFKEDSKFERSFGKGFFDEADQIAMESYRLNMKRKKQ